MLPGARAGSSGDRTRLDRTSRPGPSMMMPNGFARWRIPGETGSQRAASRRGLARTGASRTQSGNDVRTTSPRLRGELRLTLDTLSHIRLCSSHLWRSIHCAGACFGNGGCHIRNESEVPHEIPLEIVHIFEQHGFIWGGKWYHYDTMH